MTVGELFAGIGGFGLGLERAGMRVRWHSEIDPYACAVLRNHWPDIPNHGDIRNLRAGTVEPVDLICGGFPCQDVSNAGKRSGIDGDQSGLWGEFARVVRELRPRYVLVENVAALLGRGIERVLGDLAALGFDAEWHCIPAAAVGAPHLRDRVWIVAYARSDAVRHGEQRRSWRRPGDVSTGGEAVTADDGAPWSVADAVSGVRDGRADEPQRRAQERDAVDRDGAREPVADADGARPPYVREGSPWSQGLARWHAAADGGPRAARADAIGERLEGFIEGGAAARAVDRPEHGRDPDWWRTEPDVGRVADGVPARVDRLRCLGNALVPQVAEILGRAVMEFDRA